MGLVRCKSVSPAVRRANDTGLLLLTSSSILTKPLALAMIGLDISPRGFSSQPPIGDFFFANGAGGPLLTSNWKAVGIWLDS